MKAEPKSRELYKDRSSPLDIRRVSALKSQFWDALREIATARGTAVGTLVSSIDADRKHGNLSSQSAFSCSITIAPKQTRADRPKAPSKMATRCDPGGLSTENETSRAYTFWSIVGRRAPPLAFRHGENFAVHAGVRQISKCEKIRQD